MIYNLSVERKKKLVFVYKARKEQLKTSMATAKFKTSSPYVKIDQRQHDESDWKYSNYLSSLASESKNSSQCSKIVVLALFGLGRAGTIHLNNLLANR